MAGVDQHSELVSKVATRLRMIQADFADDASGDRQEQMADVIERELSKLVPEQRESFLESLRSAFPSWTNRQHVPSSAGAGSGVDQALLDDPEFLIKRLVEMAPRMGEPQRRAISDRLFETGLARATGGGSWSPESAQAIAQRLGLPRGTEVDPDRVIELLGQMIALTTSLDQLVWNTWRKVAKRSTLRSSGAVVTMLGRFASGDQDIARADVQHELEKLRQLTAALISSLGQAGRKYAQKHVSQFSPESIKQFAVHEKKMMESLDQACWRKYAELAANQDEVTIEREIMQSIVDFVESLTKGLSR